MNNYQPRPTQEGRILQLLKERGDNGVMAWELTSTEVMRDRGGAVMQYNSRIFGLRRKGYNIVNKKPGLFVLQEQKGQAALI